jgi:hypothetical protein
MLFVLIAGRLYWTFLENFILNLYELSIFGQEWLGQLFKINILNFRRRSSFVEVSKQLFQLHIPFYNYLVYITLFV